MGLAAVLRIAFLFAISLFFPLNSATAQNAVALTGQVTSAEEGAMEGVLVNAKKGTITITVVSDAQGRYSFPASKLAPGQHALSVRAIGYDLDNSKTVEVGPRTTNIRRVYVDNTTNPVTFWVGSNHGASIIKLEPLD